MALVWRTISRWDNAPVAAILIRDGKYFQGAIFLSDLRDANYNGKIEPFERAAAFFKPSVKESMKIDILNKISFSPEFRETDLAACAQAIWYKNGLNLVLEGIYEAYLSDCVESLFKQTIKRAALPKSIEKLIVKGCEKAFAEGLIQQVRIGKRSR